MGTVRLRGVLSAGTLPLGKQCSGHVRAQRTRSKCRHCFNGPWTAHLLGWAVPSLRQFAGQSGRTRREGAAPWGGDGCPSAGQLSIERVWKKVLDCGNLWKTVESRKRQEEILRIFRGEGVWAWQVTLEEALEIVGALGSGVKYYNGACLRRRRVVPL